MSTTGPLHTAAELGEAIKRARRAHGLSQIALAERANVARGALQKIETGRGTVNLTTLLKLLRILSLDLSVTSRSGAVQGNSTDESRPPTAGRRTEQR